jgi:hypothetical protein
MTRRTCSTTTFLALAVLLQSCASTTARLQQGEKPKDFGIPFREPLPYLLVTSEVATQRSNDGRLYSYGTATGFLPVCDQLMKDPANFAAQSSCIENLRKLRATSIGDGERPTPGAKDGKGSKTSFSTPRPADRSSEVAFATQHFRDSRETALVADKQPAASKKDIGGKSGGTTTGKDAAPADDPFAAAPPPNEPAPGENSKADAKADSLAGTALQAPLQIVYLPSPCRVYGLAQTNFLAKNKLTIALTNGWQLTSLTSEGDATDVVGKLLDTISSVVSTLKGAPAAAAADTKKPADTTKQGMPENLYARVTTKYIPPGLYPLMTCNADGTITGLPMPSATLERTDWVIALAKD